MQQRNNDVAILSSFDKYTTFSFGGKKLTFRTCNGLERYTKVLLWDNGYIEVMAKYKQRKDEIEEYIDLAPVLGGFTKPTMPTNPTIWLLIGAMLQKSLLE